MKQTYIIILELDTQIADEYNKLAADYENLSPQEHQNFSLLSDAILYGNSMLQLKLVTDTSTISWLPVNGTVPPINGKRYLFTNGEQAFGLELHDARQISGGHGWYYTDMPTFTPGTSIPDR